MLNFFVARLNVTRQAKVAELYLRYKSLGSGEDLSSNEAVLSSFCYPLGPESQKPTEFLAAEEYTFTLTQGDGKRLPGFCRRFLPPQEVPGKDGKLRYPQVICLITESSWCAFYFKVLQILEQLMMQSDGILKPQHKELPQGSLPFQFLCELATALAKGPSLGQVIRVPLPKTRGALNVSPPKRIMLGPWEAPLECNSELVELQVPPDCGNGHWNAGISLARLLWHVPVPAMLTLISSMLLERRVILVGQSRDMVSAAVHAAAALLYPFQWHHIYLPVLPKAFKDYLTAPMPFIIGMPAQLLPQLKGIPMSEVTMIDLDLGKCEPAPGSAEDDSRLLPWRDRLEAALQAAFSRLRSPTEYENNPFIAGVLQEYLLKLLGGYRKYIHEDVPKPAGSPAGARANGGSNPSTPRNGNDGRDDTLRGSGYYFDQTAFVAQHRGGEKARQFLSLLRQSQLYEMWMQERLKMASEGWATPDSFEARVAVYQEKAGGRVRDMGTRLGVKYKTTVSKWSAMLKKQAEAAAAAGGGAGGGALGRASFNRKMAGDSGPERTPTVNLSHFFETESDTETESQISDSGLNSRSISMSSMADSLASTSVSAAAAAADDERRSAGGSAEPSGRFFDVPSPRGSAAGDRTAAAAAVISSARTSLMDRARVLKERFRDAPPLIRLEDAPRRPLSAQQPSPQSGSLPHPLASPNSSPTTIPSSAAPPAQPTHPLAASPSSTPSPPPYSQSHAYPPRPPASPTQASRPLQKNVSGHTKFLSILDAALNGVDTPPSSNPLPPQPHSHPPAAHPSSPPPLANLWSNVTHAVSNVANNLQQRTSNSTGRPPSRHPSTDLPDAPSSEPRDRSPSSRAVEDFLSSSLRSSGMAVVPPSAHQPTPKSLLELKTIVGTGLSPPSADMLKAIQPSGSAILRQQPSLEQWDPFATHAPPAPQAAPTTPSPCPPSYSAVAAALNQGFSFADLSSPQQHTAPTPAPQPLASNPVGAPQPADQMWDPFQVASFPAPAPPAAAAEEFDPFRMLASASMTPPPATSRPLAPAGHAPLVMQGSLIDLL